MPKTPNEKTEQPPPELDKGQAPPGNGKSKLRILILAAVVIVLFVAAYASGVFKKLPAGFSVARQETKPVLSKPPSETAAFQEKTLSKVGDAPVQGEKMPTDSGGSSTVSVVERKPQAAQSGMSVPPEEETGQELSPEDSESPLKANPAVPSEAPSPSTGAKPVETPVIAPKEREKPSSQEKGKSAVAGKPGAAQGGTEAQSALLDDNVQDAVKGRKKPVPAAVKEAAIEKAPETEDKSQFQLPGSLKVRIHDYSGSLAKWSLLVILDDSASMTRKTKNWASGKIQTAEAAVEKIGASLTPGSKLAVRDFSCKKSDDKKAAKAPCLSRMLYDWAESPCSGLKEKLEHADSGGITNPCAAAAYSLKKDFGASDHLTPRVIIITDGASKCAFGEAAKAFDQHKSKGKSGVDVVAIGMGRKRQAGYDKLVKKTQGKLIKVDKPVDMDSGISHYAKLLRTPVMEKVEVKGDNAVFTTSVEEEITLAPGTYTVVLPVVAGLHPSKRTVPNVKISSGEASVLDVKIKKGKPTIKVVKK